MTTNNLKRHIEDFALRADAARRAEDWNLARGFYQ